MTPRLALNDMADVALGDSIRSRQLSPRLSRRGAFAYLAHLCCRELSAMLSLASRVISIWTRATSETLRGEVSPVSIASWVTIASDGLLGIRPCGTEVQMAWAHTTFDIARVANDKSWWNRSVRETPCYPVGESSPGGLELTVPRSRIQGARPEPTRLRLFDVRPEPRALIHPCSLAGFERG